MPSPWRRGPKSDQRTTVRKPLLTQGLSFIRETEWQLFPCTLPKAVSPKSANSRYSATTHVSRFWRQSDLDREGLSVGSGRDFHRQRRKIRLALTCARRANVSAWARTSFSGSCIGRGAVIRCVLSAGEARRQRSGVSSRLPRPIALRRTSAKSRPGKALLLQRKGVYSGQPPPQPSEESSWPPRTWSLRCRS